MNEIDKLRAENTRLNDELYREREAHRQLTIAYAELRRCAEDVVSRQRSNWPTASKIHELAATLEKR